MALNRQNKKELDKECGCQRMDARNEMQLTNNYFFFLLIVTKLVFIAAYTTYSISCRARAVECIIPQMWNHLIYQMFLELTYLSIYSQYHLHIPIMEINMHSSVVCNHSLNILEYMDMSHGSTKMQGELTEAKALNECSSV